MFHANVPRVFLFSSVTLQNFSILKFPQLRIVFFCQQLGDLCHWAWIFFSQTRVPSSALHQNCAIRIIVLNFAELTLTQTLLSTRLSTLMCKTSSCRNNSCRTSASLVLYDRPFRF